MLTHSAVDVIRCRGPAPAEFRDGKTMGKALDKLNQLIVRSVKEGYSDLHITGGHQVVYRHHGLIVFDKTRQWTHREVDAVVRELLNDREVLMLQRRHSVDVARTIHHIRVRVNVFNSLRGLSLAIRLLPGRVPEIEQLNLHPSLKKYAALETGLILVCGATGCGKSTTIAALIEEINRTRPTHIITLEDPVEYRFLSKRSFIEQRELGTHIPTFEQGLIDVLRENPDVIVVGELREPETMRLTLNAVESGHLVVASLHATNSEDALYRICNSFPPEAQEVVRTQLASTLAVMVVQRLQFMRPPGFRVPTLSILVGSQPVKSVIRENKLSLIEGIIQTGRNLGMFTMDKYGEYLESRTRFTSPQENFAPSEEATSEELYHSPLLEVRIPGPGYGGGPYGETTGRQPYPATAPQQTWQTGQLYNIESHVPIGDVVAQLSLDQAQTDHAVRQGSTAQRADASPAGVGTGFAGPDAEAGYYVIDEETSVSDVVAQIYESPETLDRLLWQANHLERPRDEE